MKLKRKIVLQVIKNLVGYFLPPQIEKKPIITGERSITNLTLKGNSSCYVRMHCLGTKKKKN